MSKNKEFIEAINNGYTEEARALIKEGADLKVVGTQALFIAVSRDHFDNVKMLIEEGVDINKKDIYGRSALLISTEHAVVDGDYDILKLLLKNGADRKSVPTPLMHAVSKNNLTVVNILLDESYPSDNGVNSKTKRDGETALMMALRNKDIVKTLLKHGANKNIKDKYGQTALMHAKNMHYGDLKEIKAIIDILEEEPGKRRRTRKRSDVVNCPPGKVMNPKTRRCVKATGKIGQTLDTKACPPGKIMNPSTGRCVNISGAIGRKIAAL